MYFENKIWKNQRLIGNLHPQICQNAKFQAKQTTLKFGTKNVLFGYFWIVILDRHFHI